ncbi:hypothetical protein DFH08DRAFT_366501 [Mycena albidolilacea]|uniref:Uncharacterized protein n=1 Tax=Mycena albidolilacea TaxID=1033008 RepID=A0AAD7AK69_9AGAR|nr:hypothetical protein DFH08DRAFT_366501 [Mycena albidolilacea]
MADTKDTAQQQPKFDWDYDVPDTPFWRDLPFTAGRNFLTCYSPSELEDMNFDGTLSVPSKFAFLLSLLEARLATRKAAAAPVLLHVADYPEWARLMLGIETMQKNLDMPEEAETLRIMLETSEGDRRVSWLNMLAGFKLRHGEYAEAERLEREVLPWMQKHERLGVDSPQALGTTRTIIEALWKQGGSKVDEARRLAEETAVLVEAMGSSKFAKYQEEERQMLRDLVAELEKS